jgi:peptide/nickel transport system substrate-binding protein
VSSSWWDKVTTERMKRRRVLQMAGVGGAAITAATLIGCGGSDSGSSGSSTSGTDTDATGPLAAKQELKVRFYDDPGGFDPATLFRIEVENIAFNVFSGLTSYEPENAKITADLAESWEMPDPTTYNFKLRKGVKFHKGFGDFTAQDVVYSYKRIMDAATASSYRAEFNNVDTITAPDDFSVVIKLKGPDANFLHQVANYHQGQIVSRASVEKLGADYKFNPIGTGPFVFDSFTPAQRIMLKGFKEYYKGAPSLESIDFRIIKDDNTAAIALQNGEVDVAMRVSQNEPLERVMKDGRFTMNKRAGYAPVLTIFNMENQYLKDARVRYAYAHAIDHATVQKTIAPLTGGLMQNLVPDWMDVYTSDHPKYAYDEKKAKELLSAAGYASGITLKQPTLAVNEQTQLQESYLNKVGIKSDFQIMDTPTYNGVRVRGEFDIGGRLLPAVNPDTILFSYLHKDNLPPKGLNGARYTDSEISSMLEKARAEPAFEKRKALYAAIQKKVLTDLPYQPTAGSAVFWPAYKYVTGIKINPLAQVGFYDVKMLQH